MIENNSHLDQLRADVGPHLLNVLRPADLGALDQTGQRFGGGGTNSVVKVELQHRNHQANGLQTNERTFSIGMDLMSLM